MRKNDIAYVKNPPNYYPPVDYKNMTLQEIVNTYIKTCGKANGLVSACSKCQSPCEYGKRAIQLLSGAIYDEPNVPLFANDSLIQKAVEENRKRKEEREMAEQKVKEAPKKAKDNRQYLDDWYEKAVASGDPVKWVMEQFGITKTKAKSKIYCWRYRHKEEVETKNVEVIEANFKEEKKPVETPVVKIEKQVESDNIEAKMDALMKLQDKHRKIMEEYKAQYEKAKQNYDEIAKKIDILCSAMDILNDN